MAEQHRDSTINNFILRFGTLVNEIEEHQKTCYELEKDLQRTKRALKRLETERKNLIKEFKQYYANMEE